MIDYLDISLEQLFSDALAAVDKESDRLQAERNAFKQFATQVAEFRVGHTPTSHSRTISCTLDTARQPRPAIREAYETTVMNVPHYDEEYGETYEQNLHAELGKDIAAIFGGIGSTKSGQCQNNVKITRHHKELMLRSVQEAIKSREEVIDALADERTSITTFQEPVCTLADDLERIQATTDDYSPKLIDAYKQRIDVFLERSHSLLERRQHNIVGARRELFVSADKMDVQTYVYEDLPVSYPVVVVITELIKQANELNNEFNGQIYN